MLPISRNTFYAITILSLENFTRNNYKKILEYSIIGYNKLHNLSTNSPMSIGEDNIIHARIESGDKVSLALIENMKNKGILSYTFYEAAGE